LNASPRPIADYTEALVMSLEEEISGEVYFERLATFFSGRERLALLMLAAVEAATAEAMRPLALRRKLKISDFAKLRDTGLAEADRRLDLSWAQLVEEMASTFPAFVEEFECMERLAPADDREVIQILVAHEVAAVAFAKLEANGDPESLRPLEGFLARHRREPAQSGF
jgi:hypothetical protein